MALTSEQEAARESAALLTAWVDERMRADKATFDALSPEGKQDALAQALSMMLPLHVVPGGKE